MTEILKMIDEYIQAINSERLNFDFVRLYNEIVKRIKCFSLPPEELKSFLSAHTSSEALRHQIRVDIHKFNQNLGDLENYNYPVEYMRIYNSIKSLVNPSPEMRDFISEKNKERIKNALHTTPRRFVSAKYVPKRDWDILAKEAVFSKQLLRYKDYATYRYNMENLRAFNEINKIMFKKLSEMIQEIRKTYGSSVNVILCACPSSSPEKISTVRLSIAEFVKTHQSALDCSDLLVRTQQIEPAHLSSDRSIDKHKRTIAINTNKYGPEFFNRKNIYIICDDIYTTGNTIKACRQYLLAKQTIPNSIYIYTIAETESLYDQIPF